MLGAMLLRILLPWGQAYMCEMVAHRHKSAIRVHSLRERKWTTEAADANMAMLGAMLPRTLLRVGSSTHA